MHMRFEIDDTTPHGEFRIPRDNFQNVEKSPSNSQIIKSTAHYLVDTLCEPISI